MDRSIGTSDYRLYSRPAPGGGGDYVEVVDDGGELPAAPARAQAEAGETGPAAGAAGGWGPDTAPRSRFNPYLCAAWAVVALMLAGGLTWLSGALPEMATVYSSSAAHMTSQDLMRMNFQMMGVYLLPFGLAGALALLTVQAARYRGPGRRRS
ncbi:hypothetical protein GD627_07315 [Arthrobacter yangruifuii]|uniref:Uncharacterized protein n=1 Tax=Arthrobacter yangruifuii TaxID=2606616 RepID=A0A5N6MR49_9MICC|nr:hypothetical protein [Arthrobacter yangruifuii]KAD3720610.1 hypothetical protein GD627_07315 [Arthrobacter yangruifuii]